MRATRRESQYSQSIQQTDKCELASGQWQQILVQDPIIAFATINWCKSATEIRQEQDGSEQVFENANRSFHLCGF